MKRLLALALCLALCLCGLAGCGDSAADDGAVPVARTSAHDVACFRVDGVVYPVVFGEPLLTREEIQDLLPVTDPAALAETITTVPDCLRYMKAKCFAFGESKNVKTTLTTGQGTPYDLCRAMVYLLDGDYRQCGRIDLTGPEDRYAMVCVELNDVYYLFDPSELDESGQWLGWLSGEGVCGPDADALVAAMVEQCPYGDFTAGAFVS